MATIPHFINMLQQFPQHGPAAVIKAGPAIEIIAVGTMRRAMTDSVSPDGTPYLPLGGPRLEGGTKPLLNKGLLRAALSASATDTELRLSALRPGARVHQFGAVIRPVKAKALSFMVGPKGSPRRVIAKSVTIPPRPYLGLTKEAVDRISYEIALAAGQIFLESCQ